MRGGSSEGEDAQEMLGMVFAHRQAYNVSQKGGFYVTLSGLVGLRRRSSACHRAAVFVRFTGVVLARIESGVGIRHWLRTEPRGLRQSRDRCYHRIRHRLSLVLGTRRTPVVK